VQVERRIGSRGGVERAAEKGRVKGGDGAGGTGAAAFTGADRKGAGVVAEDGGLGPGGEVDLGGVEAAGGRGDEDRALAFAEGEVEVGVEQAGKLVEAGDQAERASR
jgi:hypothetical protein